MLIFFGGLVKRFVTFGSFIHLFTYLLCSPPGSSGSRWCCRPGGPTDRYQSPCKGRDKKVPAQLQTEPEHPADTAGYACRPVSQARKRGRAPVRRQRVPLLDFAFRCSRDESER